MFGSAGGILKHGGPEFRGAIPPPHTHGKDPEKDGSEGTAAAGSEMYRILHIIKRKVLYNMLIVI